LTTDTADPLDMAAPTPVPPPAETVALANALAKLPFFEAFDAEAVLAAIKEKGSVAPGGALAASQLKEAFLALGYDKPAEEAPPAEPAAEGEEKKEEDGSAAPAAPAAPPLKPATQHAEAAFALLLGAAGAKPGSALPLARALGTLQVCKAGFGEAALRFALKCAASDEGGALKEAPLHVALATTASLPLSDAARNNLRRAWRAAAKFEPPVPEPSGEEGAPPPVAPAVAPEDAAVMVEDFVAKLAEDETLAFAFTRAVEVPIVKSEAPAEAAAE